MPTFFLISGFTRFFNRKRGKHFIHLFTFLILIYLFIGNDHRLIKKNLKINQFSIIIDNWNIPNIFKNDDE